MSFTILPGFTGLSPSHFTGSQPLFCCMQENQAVFSHPSPRDNTRAQKLLCPSSDINGSRTSDDFSLKSFPSCLFSLSWLKTFLLQQQMHAVVLYVGKIIILCIFFSKPSSHLLYFRLPRPATAPLPKQRPNQLSCAGAECEVWDLQLFVGGSWVGKRGRCSSHGHSSGWVSAKGQHKETAD